MKKYAVIDIKGDQFEDLFDTEAEAIASAETQWDHLTENEKNHREFFAVMYGDLDEDDCFDLSTASIIKAYKA